jgi:hypothetical protein
VWSSTSTPIDFKLSQTSAHPNTTLIDLVPDTIWKLRVRSTSHDETSGWGDWGPSFECSTLRQDPSAPTNLRRRLNSTNGVIAIWDTPFLRDVVFHVWSKVKDGQWIVLGNTSNTQYNLSTEVDPGTELFVKVQAGHATCDPVLFRVGISPASRYLSLIRVSERQSPVNSEIDFLSNHDSGDAAGDSLFMTAMGEGGKFISVFANTTITQYCVEALAGAPWADYVSCNPADGASPRNYSQVCVCANEMDRRIGHANFQPYCGVNSTPWSLCNCSVESAARSSKFVGRMPVYLPWACGDSRSGNGTCAIDIPSGFWYSTPAAGQCKEGESLGVSTTPSLTSCTWRRIPTSHVVLGSSLLARGWNDSSIDWASRDVSQFVHNTHILREVFAEVTARPCGW